MRFCQINVLKLVRTVADLDACADIRAYHLAEALQYREGVKESLPTMSRKSRYSKEQRVEQQSIRQFQSRVGDYGWVVEKVTTDLGEDLLIRVYDQGESTGLTFYTQLKATENLSRHLIQGDVVSYSVKVKDLEHWEYSSTVVIFVVWDVKKEAGYWAFVPDVIKFLDKQKPTWRNQKTVKVHIPLTNLIDDKELDRIRFRLADYYGPILLKGKPLEIKMGLAFPDTSEGRSVLEAFQRSITKGDRVRIDGQYIQAFELPDAHRRIYGDLQIADEGFLEIYSVPSEKMFPTMFEILREDRVVANVPFIAFQTVKQGTEEITLSNEDQSIPLKFKMIVNSVERSLDLSFNMMGVHVTAQKTKDAIEFLRAMTETEDLRITNLTTGLHVTLKSDSLLNFEFFEEWFIELIDNLSIIEELIRCEFDLREFEVTTRDVNLARDTASIIQTGYLPLEGKNITVEIKRPDLVKLYEKKSNDMEPRFKITGSGDSESVELFGITIPMGPNYIDVIGTSDISMDELQSAIKHSGESDSYEIVLNKLEGKMTYPQWLPEDQDE